MITLAAKPTSKLSRVFAWLDTHLLFIAAAFLLVFIPIYPKVPLADLLPGYIVRLRIEDLLIGLVFGLWCVQLLRGHITWKTPLTKMILVYLIIGLLSTLSAIFITHTVPESKVHVEKVFLHYFRRIQYFSLFFVAFSAVQTIRQAKYLLGLLGGTVLAVGLYGVGQKYLYWPVYSTMNREFSKGLRLYLTEHARVQSTFGGHYDFAAFLVMGLPLVLALFFLIKKWWVKLILGLTFLVGLWGMMMTSSRSSFLAYLLAILILFGYLLITKGLWWATWRAGLVLATTFIFLYTFGDLSERFGQIFRDNATYASIEQSINDLRQKAQAPLIAPPQEAISIDDVNKAAAAAAKLNPDAGVIDASDTTPSIGQPKNTLPPDVFVDVPAAVIATKSAQGKVIEVVIPRVFSENARRLGLSAAIRLDTLWPFAIRGFLSNPLLGSGYSTLTKYTNEEFTEAESTDNDFLRTLGETGALGFITFYGTMFVSMIFIAKTARKSADSWLKMFSVVLIAVTAGLFMNAVYIDVFVSSKVIETYWILTGALLAWAVIVRRENKHFVSVVGKREAKKPALQIKLPVPPVIQTRHRGVDKLHAVHHRKRI